MKKLVSLVLTAALVALMFAGCSPSAPAADNVRLDNAAAAKDTLVVAVPESANLSGSTNSSLYRYLTASQTQIFDRLGRTRYRHESGPVSG